MKQRQRSRVVLALALAGGLALTGCTQTAAPTDTAAPADTSAPEDTNGADAGNAIKTGQGVTAEACPGSPNAENGCIYLGILADLEGGPFAVLAKEIVAGQQAFWDKVNADGGIGGYDVNVADFQRNTQYNPAEHAAMFEQIAPQVAAIAQTLGTVNTEGVLPQTKERSLVSVPTSWWSGYAFEDYDNGLLLETGTSYCTEAIVGLDWLAQSDHGKPETVVAVGYPGDYGGDSAEGVKRWAEINGVTALPAIGTGPNQTVGDQSAVIAAVLQAQPDAVVLAVGPAETAQIVGGLAAQGFTGRFLGSLPTWNGALLGTEAAPALTALYNHLTPYQNWDSESPAITAAKEALGGADPVNGGFIIGWAISYPMKAVLEAATEAGDITPQGLAAVVKGLEVDFEGITANHTYGGDPQKSAWQTVTVGQPDAETPLGMKSIAVDFEGETFAKTDYTSACVATS